MTLAIAASFGSQSARAMSVFTSPGAMALTRTSGASSAAHVRVRWSSAAFAANAGDPDQAEAAVEHCLERFGGIDILVNNAATNPYMGPTMDIDLPRYDKTWEVNLRGPLVWGQLAYKRSLRERSGSIINIASIGGMGVEPSIGIYNATKAALLHLTRTWAAELAPEVRVNAIAPGLVKTDMARALWEPNEAAMARSMPLARLGEPSDIGNAALFLASDLSSWITGQTIIVDGGATLGAAARRSPRS